MNTNKNSSNYNGELSLDGANECNSSSEIIVTKNQKSKKETNISEEKKLEIREKNKLAMQKRRASLSEEQKQQLREQGRLKRQQERNSRSIEEREAFNLKQRQQRKHRANLSEEDLEKLQQKDRERRANISDEDRAIVRKKNSIQHRNKYQEDKAFLKQHIKENEKSFHDKREGEDDNDDEKEDVEQVVVISGDQETNDRVNALLLNREKRNAQNRIYKKARYTQLREAEAKLKARSNDEEMSEDIDIQQLQRLANRRQQILEYARTYRQNHQKHRRWVPIQQVWDEENPCRQVKCNSIY